MHFLKRTLSSHLLIFNADKMWYGDFLRLGVLGGGQLGRMLIQSAISYDVHVYVMDISKSYPCGKIAYEFTEGNIQDYNEVIQFGKDMDVLTVEIEHVNVEALEELEKRGVRVYPQPRVLRMIQDKGLQKRFYQENNIPTAPFHLVDNRDELITKFSNQYPFVQKARKGGYDGKGVYTINTEKDLAEAFDAPSVIEEKIPFKKELSVLVARNSEGEMAAFPVVECEFNPSLNLVEFLFTPADITPAVEEKAKEIAKDVITKLDMVGLLAVEFFLTQEDELLVNEVAPRPHNSGHHTIECSNISQFEQHLRSILNLPLGNTDTVIPGVMVNLLGGEEGSGKALYQGIEDVMKIKGVYVHSYGKPETKPHRKMGHVTITDTSIEKAKEKARIVQNKLNIVPFIDKR